MRPECPVRCLSCAFHGLYEIGAALRTPVRKSTEGAGSAEERILFCFFSAMEAQVNPNPPRRGLRVLGLAQVKEEAAHVALGEAVEEAFGHHGVRAESFFFDVSRG